MTMKKEREVITMLKRTLVKIMIVTTLVHYLSQK
jgi:hypothetical protein